MADSKDLPPPYNTNFNTQYGGPPTYLHPTSYGEVTPTAPVQGQPNPYAYSNPSTPAAYSGYSNPSMPAAYSGYSNQNVIVTQGLNPTYSGTMNAASVPDNMGLAIFATILCCWPLGIVAIMRASESRSHLARGDVSAAMVSSAESRKLSLLAVGFGIFVIVATIITVVAVVVNIRKTRYFY